MTYEAPTRPAFTTHSPDRRFPIDTLDAVTLAADAQTDDGETVPAGTVGTVVAVWGEAEAFDIEFDAPFTGLVTIDREMIREHRRPA
ncbi:DUF4926 domain-containing protein [Methylobacterium sp. J-048]|uniref:DUF4926 domain-containing protein n=1 Tax=Methylobacterium sp. J-048 TaxID=2836635 RepID=UPI001FBB7A7A|nr:DUF4926 domain-containing protein [Methylobacterium sp. J-048]MCJ2059640.1 DUF4926 domain-containing protein [Methylobacterium sp. J-048]